MLLLGQQHIFSEILCILFSKVLSISADVILGSHLFYTSVISITSAEEVTVLYNQINQN